MNVGAIQAEARPLGTDALDREELFAQAEKFSHNGLTPWLKCKEDLGLGTSEVVQSSKEWCHQIEAEERFRGYDEVQRGMTKGIRYFRPPVQCLPARLASGTRVACNVVLAQVLHLRDVGQVDEAGASVQEEKPQISAAGA
eukprot:CAMPEP_0119120422 /NCGR_PEP_ID=MMETSP1310-20130426/1466_1 /TAXON_ID=464262 /ORGANISM="Genus nov. species nov., Strain RCC2339" /LENGTH=140 /DNA_ID=CAMNT_0007109899 /DNA_START=52 /DNA_END=474 /DNA_ORIENTATION=-